MSGTGRMVNSFIVNCIPSMQSHCYTCFVVFLDFDPRITQHNTLPNPSLIDISCTFKKHSRLEGSSIVSMEIVGVVVVTVKLPGGWCLLSGVFRCEHETIDVTNVQNPDRIR